MDSPSTTPGTDDDHDGMTSGDDGTGARSEGNRTGRIVVGALGAAVLAAFFLFAALSGGDDADPGAVAAVSPISDLAFATKDGDTATLAEFTGEPIVLNFFASWCAPCRAEMPEFEQVHLAREGEVKFLGVSHDLDEATWTQFVDETAITFETVYQPNQEMWEELDAKGMPSTAFISADGEVKHLYTGVLNQELLQELIDEHLLGDA